MQENIYTVVYTHKQHNTEQKAFTSEWYKVLTIVLELTMNCPGHACK